MKNGICDFSCSVPCLTQQLYELSLILMALKFFSGGVFKTIFKVSIC